jgi:peptide/nickel transport system substrate-binding protein
MKTRALLILAALFLLIPIGLAFTADQQMVIGFVSIVRSLDPATQICGEEGSLEWCVYDNLLTFDRKNMNKLAPSLAEKWSVSADGSTWTFNLRRGAKFTTGNELTADDVVYSFRRGLRINHPNYPRLAMFLLDDLNEGIKKIDKYTVQMKLKKPFAAFGTLLYDSHTGVIDSKTLEKNISKDDPDGTKYLNEHSLGTGPFMLAEWKRNEYVKMVKNPTYWGIAAKYFRVPKYDVLIDRNIPESSVQKFMMDTGEIQMAWNLTTDAVAEYEKNPAFQVIKIPLWTATAILMNPREGSILKDPNVRRAIRWAIDYESIITDILKGYAMPMDRPIFRPYLGSLKEGEQTLYWYDLNKAKEYMSKSQYPNGGQFTLMIGTGGGFGAPWEILAQKEASDLSKIGIRVKMEQYDWSVVDEKQVAGDFEAVQIWCGASPNEAAGNVLAQIHTSDSFFLGSTAYRNKRIDELADKTMGEMDQAKREQMFAEINKIMADDGPYAWVAQKVSTFVFPKKVQGFDRYPGPYQFDFAVLYRE